MRVWLCVDSVECVAVCDVIDVLHGWTSYCQDFLLTGGQRYSTNKQAAHQMRVVHF